VIDGGVRDLKLLLAISLTFAPYACLTGEAALLPVVFAGLCALASARLSLVPFGCIAGIALVEVLARVTLPSGFYVWTAPAWLAWYLYTLHVIDRRAVRVAVAAR
jgi:hypothetical protein